MLDNLKNRFEQSCKFNKFRELDWVKLSKKPLNYITCNVKNRGLTKSEFYCIVFIEVAKGTVTKYSW